MSKDNTARMEILLKRVYDLILNGEGGAHLEVDGGEAKAIFDEIRMMRVNGEIV